ncbi:hypothetical protein BOW53_02165 [Solemya pervernicosa gill symbiont]|uniref:WbqC family protein n=1 Tax=Solemya pervernicosa gill symbiont TaxID=642797 RepID=A0A1T2LA35_9GAMM|nr:WbqC family protein [Solemya pervernicosa gill symbiont]OOZ41872.1 hypothetical protein BOW53_02165 [Solemya pervernicosa gill symbiont]
MIVSIMQPAYLPWLGYFDRIAQSDVHIVLDDVALERSSKTRFTNRNKVRTKEGIKWLTVPVKTAGLGQPLISQIEIDNGQPWRKKHWQTLLHSYSQAPCFHEHKTFFENYYAREWPKLGECLKESTQYLLDVLGINVNLLYSSEMIVEGVKSELILNLCQSVGATKYISGPFGRDYLNGNAFESAGIELSFHDYHHPVYKQYHGGFEPYVSIVDLLFNHGSKSLEILTSYE